MSIHHVIRTTRLTDSQILQLLFAFKDKEQLDVATITLSPHFLINVTNMERSDDVIAGLDNNRHAIQSVAIRIPNTAHVSFFRGVCNNVQEPERNRQASQYFDEVVVVFGNLAVDSETQQRITSCIDIIERTLPKTVPLQEMDQGHGVIEVLQAEISSLADQYKRMLDGLAKEREEFRTAADGERKAARQTHQTAMNEVAISAEERKRKFDEYRTEQEDALNRRSKELDERESDLDNRQHMHARRELREKISENFKQRVSRPVVSGPAKWMQLAVFVLSMIAGVYLGYLGFVDFRTLIETNSAEGFPGWLAAGWAFRSVVALVMAIGFVLYAINWLRNVYLDDVRTRRQYERYGHDIDRASFVIETILEVNVEGKTEVPDTWIDGVCRNLFHDDADETQGNPSASAAALLFESISGAKIGPNGTEVSMGRRDSRRFAKKLSEG